MTPQANEQPNGLGAATPPHPLSVELPELLVVDVDAFVVLALELLPVDDRDVDAIEVDAPPELAPDPVPPLLVEAEVAPERALELEPTLPAGIEPEPDREVPLVPAAVAPEASEPPLALEPSSGPLAVGAVPQAPLATVYASVLILRCGARAKQRPRAGAEAQ